MNTLWRSPCQENCLSPDGEAFPCLGQPGPSLKSCRMNVWNVVKMNRLADKLYQAGFPYGAWVVRLDAAGLFPVCELLFLTEEPTEALLRERFGARLLRFARFDAHHPPAR